MGLRKRYRIAMYGRPLGSPRNQSFSLIAYSAQEHWTLRGAARHLACLYAKGPTSTHEWCYYIEKIGWT